jgi:hypothetical protein
VPAGADACACDEPAAGSSPASPGLDPMPLIAELIAALQRMNAPKRIVRDETGKPIGIEPIT